MSETPLDGAEDTENQLPDDRVLPNVTHNRSGWRQGCRCGVCRADHREANKERRRKKREEHKNAIIAEKERHEYQLKHHRYSLMVAEQLDSLDAVASNPGIAAICLKMAAILDDDTATPQQPAAAARLLDALKELGVRPKQASQKLADVRNMVNRPLRAVQDGETG